MRWFWMHVKPNRTRDEVLQSRERAEFALDQVRAQRPEAEEQALRLRSHRIENHFAQKIELTMWRRT